MAELGNHNAVFTSEDSNAVGDALLMGPFGVGITGIITTFHLYVAPGGSTSNFRGLIYNASGSNPGTMLATLGEVFIQDSTTDPTKQWHDITGLSIAFTGPIYLGFWQGSPSPLFYTFEGSGPGFYAPTATFAAYHATNPAPNWNAATDTPTTAQKMAVYVGYLATGSVPQSSSPVSDISSGLWTPSAGASLFGTIDEATASDSDYDSSGASPVTADIMEVKFRPMLNPQVDDDGTSHHVKFRLIKNRSGGDVLNVTIRLMQGATEIASWTKSNISATATDYDETLTNAQANAITNYEDLRMRVEAVKV